MLNCGVPKFPKIKIYTLIHIIPIILLLSFINPQTSSGKTYSLSHFEISERKSNKGKSKSKKKKKVSKVIKTARSYLGTTYKYGGFSRNGIDCSGLICNSFKSVNIELPRTSKEQSHAGKAIAINDIQAGDLLFFTDKKGNTKITHVGLVTEVKGNKNIKFIHSSTKLGVVEDNLYADYYLPLFLKAVRVIN